MSAPASPALLALRARIASNTVGPIMRGLLVQSLTSVLSLFESPTSVPPVPSDVLVARAWAACLYGINAEPIEAPASAAPGFTQAFGGLHALDDGLAAGAVGVALDVFTPTTTGRVLVVGGIYTDPCTSFGGSRAAQVTTGGIYSGGTLYTGMGSNYVVRARVGSDIVLTGGAVIPPSAPTPAQGTYDPSLPGPAVQWAVTAYTGLTLGAPIQVGHTFDCFGAGTVAGLWVIEL